MPTTHVLVNFACSQASPRGPRRVGVRPGAYNVVASTPDGRYYRHERDFAEGDARMHRLIEAVEARGRIDLAHWKPCRG